MANVKHLKILKQGVAIWNDWRINNPEILPDLIGVNLKNKNLAGINLSNTDLRGINFSNTNLSGANFCGSKMGLLKAQSIFLTLLSNVLVITSVFFSIPIIYFIVSIFSFNNIESQLAGVINGIGLLITLLGITKQEFTKGILYGILIFIVGILLIFVGQQLGFFPEMNIRLVILGITIVSIPLLLYPYLGALSHGSARVLKGISGSKIASFSAALSYIVIVAYPSFQALRTEAFSTYIPAFLASFTLILIFVALTIALIYQKINTITLILSGSSIALISIMLIAIITAFLQLNLAVFFYLIVVIVGISFMLGLYAAAGVICLLFALHLSNEALMGNSQYNFLRNQIINFTTLGATNFTKANLTKANFSQTTISNTNFRGAVIDSENFKQLAKLSKYCLF